MGEYNLEKIIRRLGADFCLIFSLFRRAPKRGVTIWGSPYPPWHPGVPNICGVPEIRPPPKGGGYKLGEIIRRLGAGLGLIPANFS